MAKYNIRYKCGHKEEVQLFGPNVERDRRIKWLESQECDNCRRAKAESEAIASAKARGLPDLEGSGKQVTWATTIRERAYKALDCLAPFASASSNSQAKQLVDAWKSKMDAQTQAKWWIDNRDSLPSPFSDATNRQAAASAAREIIRQFNALFG